MALCEKRPMPSTVPSSVARTMPMIATRSVFRTPITKAIQYGSSDSYGMIVSPMSKPAAPPRKSKPLWMPRASMLASVFCARYQTPKPMASTAITW